MALGEEIVVLVTTSSEEEAIVLGKMLVDQQLVACATILPKVKSIFQWEGKVAEEEECLMVLKTVKPLFHFLKKVIIAQHSYDVPEIIALPIVDGLESYLTWVHEMTQKPNIA